MAAQLAEILRTLPVLAEADVLIVGSGPAGLAAAIAASREGASTILVERFGCFGGNITQVGVEGFAWYRHEGTTDVEGIGIEFERRAKEMGATHPEPQSKSEALDAEMFKVVADRFAEEAGVTPFLHCYAVDAVADGKRLRGVLTESKSGRTVILAKCVIDATGDADIAFRAGAPCEKPAREQMMGTTVVFACSGIDRERFLEYVREGHPTYGDWGKNWAIKTTGKEDRLFSPYLEEPFNRARQDGLIPPELKGIGGTWSTLTDAGEATGLNLVYMGGYDGTDVRDITRAEIEGRRQAVLAIEALRRYVPGFEKAKLRNFGMKVGVRDTRRIVGRYQLTEQDVRNQGRFNDSVGIFPEFIDGRGLLILPTTGHYFQIPFRILVPHKVEGLLVSGRCVASDPIAHAAIRSMMCCTVTGQAAGVAGALSVKDEVDCSQVDIPRLQGALKRQGVRIA
jgi:hypothetical protein